jgi:hypothetical protein
MKTVPFLFVLVIATVLPPGTSLARRADHPSQRTHSQSSDKSDSKHQSDVEVQGENEQTRSGRADEISKRSAYLTKITTKRRSSTIHSQAAVSHPPSLDERPATNGPWMETAGAVTRTQQTSLKNAVSVPGQAVSHRGLSAPSPAVSVSGQQFKNSRDPGAHLAISGGTMTAARGTAAINGTNMKRKF